MIVEKLANGVVVRQISNDADYTSNIVNSDRTGTPQTDVATIPPELLADLD